jgi:hypothetical protein
MEIKSPLESRPYCFRIHGRISCLVSSLYPNEANKPGYGQFYIFDSAAVTIKRLNQSNQGCMSEVMLRLDELLQRINPFAESQQRIHHRK